MPNITEEDVAEEQRLFSNVIATFEQYGPYALSANNRRRKDFFKLPLTDQKLLEDLGYKTKLAEVDSAIIANAAFVRQIIADTHIFSDADLSEDDGFDRAADEAGESGQSYSHSHTHDHPHDHGVTHSHDHSLSHSNSRHSHTHPHVIGGDSLSRKPYRPTDFDMDKLRSTIKQFVRDWSEEGKVERDACYEPLLEALLQHFANVPDNERGKLRVLVPGAGLGRLAYDVARLGFSCQGNEFSHYMLLASFFMLNRTERVHQHTIYPYVHSFSNIPNKEALLRPVSIPDVLPSDIPKTANFSLVAGDFEEIYGTDDNDDDQPQSGQWDAILTCFFIDTAKSVINYLRVIHRKLAPGGVWINLGPLLWHWENNTTNDLSVELDLDEVKALCAKMGFRLANERTIDATYTNNHQSMLGYVYNTAFWTATKIED